MQRINTSTAVNGKFIDGSAVDGKKATQFSAAWCNAVQDEIANVIEEKEDLNPNNNSQLKNVINNKITSAQTDLNNKVDNVNQSLTNSITAVQTDLNRYKSSDKQYGFLRLYGSEINGEAHCLDVGTEANNCLRFQVDLPQLKIFKNGTSQYTITDGRTLQIIENDDNANNQRVVVGRLGPSQEQGNKPTGFSAINNVGKRNRQSILRDKSLTIIETTKGKPKTNKDSLIYEDGTLYVNKTLDKNNDPALSYGETSITGGEIHCNQINVGIDSDFHDTGNSGKIRANTLNISQGASFGSVTSPIATLDNATSVNINTQNITTNNLNVTNTITSNNANLVGGFNNGSYSNVDQLTIKQRDENKAAAQQSIFIPCIWFPLNFEIPANIPYGVSFMLGQPNASLTVHCAEGLSFASGDPSYTIEKGAFVPVYRPVNEDVIYLGGST